MTIGIREWLPGNVLDHGVVRQTVEQAIARWDAQWFAMPYAEVAATRAAAADPRPDADGTGWRVYRTAIAIRAGRAAFSRMVNRSLDLKTAPATVTEIDRYVLDRLEAKMLESLAEVLESAFGVDGAPNIAPDKPADPFSGGGGLLVSLADESGREGLTLAIPCDLAFRCVKASFARTSAVDAPLQPLGEVLADIVIPVEAQIGNVELTLAELNELAVGDVLILDQRLEAAVGIAGIRSRDVFAKAVLTNVKEGFAVAFEV